MKKSRMMSLVLVGMFAVSSVFAGNVTVQAETGGQSKMLSNRVHSLQNINQSKVLPETKRTLSADKSYTDEELCKLAADYCYKKYKKKPPFVVVDSVEGDLVTIHLYEIVEEEDGTGHTATYDWYYVSRKTAKGEDLFGNKIDLQVETNAKKQSILTGNNIKMRDNVFKFISELLSSLYSLFTISR